MHTTKAADSLNSDGNHKYYNKLSCFSENKFQTSRGTLTWITLITFFKRLKSSFRKFYGRYGDLIEQYGVTLSRMLNDILTLDQQ